MNVPPLSGKVVLLVGAGRGIGRATALACARAGAHLVVNDLGCALDGSGKDPGVIAELARELRELGAEVESSPEDATSRLVPDQLVRLAIDRFGRLDAMFVTLGIRRERALTRLDDDDFDRLLDVHLRAPMRLTRAAAAAMQSSERGGSILLCTAQSAFVGARGQTGYAAAASGIVGFVRASALELRRHGIAVNALAPLARTRATEDLPMFQSIRQDSLPPESAAALALHLLGESAREVSGEIVGVAGNRVYALRLHETAGSFLEGEITSEQLTSAWPQITRP